MLQLTVPCPCLPAGLESHEWLLALLLVVCFLAGLGAGMMLRGNRESSLTPAAVLSLSPALGVPAVGAPAVAT